MVTTGDKVVWGPGNFYLIVKFLGKTLRRKITTKDLCSRKITQARV